MVASRKSEEYHVKITAIDPLILHAPVTGGGISDSLHSISHWGLPGVAIRTDSGEIGYGFAGTHAHLPTDRLITQCITEAYAPLLLDRDPMENRALWHELYSHSPIHWVGRAGIVHLALAAVDIALWDLKAKQLQLPLWKLLGGSGNTHLEAYNTDAG